MSFALKKTTLKNPAKLLSATILTLMLTSCYAGARSENMVVGTMPSADFGKYTHNIAVAHTANDTRWDSRISEKDFRAALTNSLYYNNLLNDQSPEYQLDANVVKLTPPSMDFDMYVTADVQYVIHDIQSGKIIVDKTIETRAAASEHDEALITDRKRVANERVMAQNFQDFINYLRR